MLSTVISSLLMGILAATSGFSPLAEFQRFVDNKKRIFYALLIGTSGFIFMVGGFFLAIIEAALQYEAQGFLFWTALFTLATGLLLSGLLFVLVAKVTMPQILPSRVSLDFLNNPQFNFMPLLETWLKQQFDATQSTAPTDESEYGAPPTSAARPKVSAEKSQFCPQPVAPQVPYGSATQ